MTQLQLRTSSGFVDPADVRVRGSSGWVSANRVSVYTGSGWIEVWPMSTGTSGTITATSQIEVYESIDNTDNYYVSSSYPVVDITQSSPTLYQYFVLTFYIDYTETGSTSSYYITDHPASFYLKRVTGGTEYFISDMLIEWAVPTLTVHSLLAITGDGLYDLVGSGTYTMYMTTTLNGVDYRFESPQQLIL